MSIASRPAARPVATGLADSALFAVTFIWGFTFPVVKSALSASSPLLFNAVRMSAAAFLLFVILRPRRFVPAAWLSGASLGFLLAAGYAFQTAGLALTSPSVSAFVTGLSVVLVPLLLALGWRRHLGWPAWCGALLALAGLYFLTALPAGSASAHGRAGVWLTLAGALAFALQIIVLGETVPRFGFRELAALQILFAAVFTWLAVPAMARLEPPVWHNSSGLWLAIAATAVFATAVAFTVQSWAQQFTPATHAAVIFAAEPVFAWLASLAFWHERLRTPQLAGAALILAAMLIVERAGAAALRSPGSGAAA